MPENRELGGYTKVKQNELGDTVVVKKDLLGRTVGEKTIVETEPKKESWAQNLVHKADQTIKDVAHRLEHKPATTNPVILDKDIPKTTKGAYNNTKWPVGRTNTIVIIRSRSSCHPNRCRSCLAPH